MGNLRWARRRTWALQLAFGVGAASWLALTPTARGQNLPDAPSALLTEPQSGPQPVEDNAALDPSPDGSSPQKGDALARQNLPPCSHRRPAGSPRAGGAVTGENKVDLPCKEDNPIQPITGATKLPALSAGQKGYLAVRDVVDPFNLVTIIGYSGIAIAANSHTAYGPGFRGFGRLTGYSLVEDTTGEFFGTFLIPSLAHQDPRYYRMPGRPFTKRLLHAVSHTVLTRHDDGTPMPNYATLLTYPISAELTNLYVPGVAVNAKSTGKRIALGLATDPVGQIIAEFLPDVARRIHVRVIFVQQIIQQLAESSVGGPVATQ